MEVETVMARRYSAWWRFASCQMPFGENQAVSELLLCYQLLYLP